MNFNVVPPLAFTSALSITVSLYYHADIQTHGERALHIGHIIRKVHSLPVPDLVKNQVLGLVQPVGKEIEQWLNEFHSLLYWRVETRYLNLYQKLSWTPLGTIDYKRTAENCILSCSLNMVQIFALATTCGNVYFISGLWPIVASSRNYTEWRSNSSLKHNIIFDVWEKYFNMQSVDSGTFNSDEFDKSMFREAVHANSVGTAEFFIQKLNPQLKKATIVELFHQQFWLEIDELDVNMLLFLVSQLDNESLRKIFGPLSIDILVYFLEWPLQQFFLPLIEWLGNVFPAIMLFRFMRTISFRIVSHSLQPDMYKDICEAFWLKFPANVQARYFNKRIVSDLLGDMFSPYETEFALSQLFKEPEEALIKFRNKLLPSVGSWLNILICKNLHEVVKDILQQQFAEEIITDDFDRLYKMYTRIYADDYNGIQYVWQKYKFLQP